MRLPIFYFPLTLSAARQSLTINQTMNLNRLTHDADDLIRKVVSRYNQLYVPAGTISQLELDLMLDDLRKLYDTFKNIGQINLTLQNSSAKPEVKVNPPAPAGSHYVAPANQNFKEDIDHSAQPAQAPITHEQKPIITSETHQNHKAQFSPEPEPEIVLPEETEEEFVTESELSHPNQVPFVAEMTKPVEESEQINNPVNTEPVTGMLADKFNTGNKSLSETIASSQAQEVMGSRLLFQPIADLNTGIGLNDKFSFISDLFGNSSLQYDEAIARINKAVNLDEANWILQKYHTSDWDQKQESLARLKDFVKRRFI